jgi:predicted ATPase/class 3 adenylate cyclase
MPELPAATFTFLFTDIEGSTLLWEEHAEAMQLALAQHDDLLRACIETHRGTVFKTVGDAFCAVFSDPRGALEAVLASQSWLPALALTTEAGRVPLNVRMALHTGVAQKRDDDYFGPTLNRLARLLAVGHGGQVLLSAATQALVRDRLPDGASLEELGEHRLRDLDKAETVFQFCHPDLPTGFAPLRSLGRVELKHNLPQQLTSFVGREAELRQVKRLLSDTRLLTLTGAGGCGKTRLSLQAAAELIGEHTSAPDSLAGCWLVEMARVVDPHLVPQTAATALGLTEEPGRSITRTIIKHLQHRRALLILDNCEHLLDACAELATALLQGCAGVSILATSREGLGVSGETTIRVPSLSVPPASTPPTAASIAGCEGIRLFVERATQVRTDFRLTDRNAGPVAAICRRLDGIPLAIELAAARVRAMPVEEIEHRLDQRFRLLTGNSRSSLPRQQTLRSTIDWSYNLIGRPERALLLRLSAFAGGCTLAAVEAICTGPPLESWEVLDTLTGLVDKSLVIFQDATDEPRYSLLESVRSYALEKLLDSDDLEVVRTQHCGFYLALAERAAELTFGANVLTGLRSIDADLENVRTALAWALDRAERSDIALRFVAALGNYWVYGSHLREGATWTDSALAGAPSAFPALMARACQAGMYLAFFLGDMGLAEKRAAAALEAGERCGEQKLVCGGLFQVGLVAVHRGDVDQAEATAEKGLLLASAIADAWLLGRHLVLKGLSAWLRGDFLSSREHFARTLQISRDLNDEWHIAITLANLAFVTRRSGDTEGATTLHREGLDRCVRLGDRRGIGWHLCGAAGVQSERGAMEITAALLGAAAHLLQEVGAPLPVFQQMDFDHTESRCRSEIGDDEFGQHFRAGTQWSLEDAVAASVLSGSDRPN